MPQKTLAEQSSVKLNNKKKSNKKVLTDMNYTATMQHTLTIEQKTDAEPDDFTAPVMKHAESKESKVIKKVKKRFEEDKNLITESPA